jgi:23S rRNA pseudouridine2605 synthase
MEKKRNAAKSSSKNDRKSSADKKPNLNFKKSSEDKPKRASININNVSDFSESDNKLLKAKKNNKSEDSIMQNEGKATKKGGSNFQKIKDSINNTSNKQQKKEEISKYANKKSQNKSSQSIGKVSKKNLVKNNTIKEDEGTIRLNKYIANAGICSRREADELIKAGAISVNGKIITQMGYKVKPGDIVNYGGETIRLERKVYILLNKPKDYITTVDDPKKRKTVLDLIKGACKERVYPVGRLDRNTTGLLLLTNDGDLTKKLTHPSSRVKKIYHVVTDKRVSKNDLIKLTEGFYLEDGFIKADNADYVITAKSKKEIGIELHSGKYRIVRRMMEHLGYKVVKLDRVFFAGLTKKNLPRGRWRFLTEKEINMLKMLPN